MILDRQESALHLLQVVEGPPADRVCHNKPAEAICRGSQTWGNALILEPNPPLSVSIANPSAMYNVQGSKEPKKVKRGFRSRNPHVPTQEKGVSSQKIPIFPVVPSRYGEFLARSTLFWGGRRIGNRHYLEGTLPKPPCIKLSHLPAAASRVDQYESRTCPSTQACFHHLTAQLHRSF